MSILAQMLPKRQLALKAQPVSNWETNFAFPTAPGTYVYSHRAFEYTDTSNINNAMISYTGSNALIIILNGCLLKSMGRIFGLSGANIEVYLNNCVLWAQNPRVNGRSAQRILGGNPKIFEMYNCDIIGSGLSFAGSGIQRIDAKRNRWWNINGMCSNGANANGSYGWDAYQTLAPGMTNGTGFELRAALQLNGCGDVPFYEAEWNQHINQDGKVHTADTYNFINSGGTSGNWAKIRNCYGYGAGPSIPIGIPGDNPNPYTSSDYFLQLEGRARYVLAEFNQAVAHVQCGFGTDSGSEGGVHDIIIRNNRAVDGKWCLGTERNRQSANGYAFTTSGVPTYGHPYNVEFRDNYTQWWNSRSDVNNNSIYLPALANGTGNVSTGWTYGSGRASLADEANEWALWLAKLRSNDIQIGSLLRIR